MVTRVWAAGLVLAAGMGAAVAADDKKPDTPPATTRPAAPAERFTGYVHAKDVQGEVVSATDSSVTIRVYYPGMTGGGGRGRGRTTIQHKDISYDYHPDGLARTAKLPPKTDADGKKAEYTSKELDALREPSGFPGYNLTKTDIAAGAKVEIYLLRDRTVPAAKAQESDLKIKWVKVTGQAATPPAAAPGKK